MPTGQSREQRIARVFAEFAELSRGEDEGARRAFADDQRSATIAHRILRGELRLT